jgi:hypothetical protein
MEVQMSWIKQVVKMHKPKAGEACVYGILLFSDSHPHTKKIVYDDDYWRAFDEISGNRWAIFCTRAEQGAFTYPPPPPDSLAYMSPIWKEPDANKDLLKTFGFKSTNSLPCLLVFANDKDGECLKNTIKINESTQQDAYDSLKAAIETITDALENVHIENINNPVGVHAAISFAVQNAEDWEKVKRGIKFWQWLKSLI